jgi:hypothetical protein
VLINLARSSPETIITVLTDLELFKVETVSIRSNSVNLMRDSTVKNNFSLDLLVSNRLTGTIAKILSFNAVNNTLKYN